MSKVAWKLKKKDFILFDVSTCSKLALIIEKNATNLFKQLLINEELIEKCFGGDLMVFGIVVAVAFQSVFCFEIQ